MIFTKAKMSNDANEFNGEAKIKNNSNTLIDVPILDVNKRQDIILLKTRYQKRGKLDLTERLK